MAWLMRWSLSFLAQEAQVFSTGSIFLQKVLNYYNSIKNIIQKDTQK